MCVELLSGPLSVLNPIPCIDFIFDALPVFFFERNGVARYREEMERKSRGKEERANQDHVSTFF